MRDHQARMRDVYAQHDLEISNAWMDVILAALFGFIGYVFIKLETERGLRPPHAGKDHLDRLRRRLWRIIPVQFTSGCGRRRTGASPPTPGPSSSTKRVPRTSSRMLITLSGRGSARYSMFGSTTRRSTRSC